MGKKKDGKDKKTVESENVEVIGNGDSETEIEVIGNGDSETEIEVIGNGNSENEMDDDSNINNSEVLKVRNAAEAATAAQAEELIPEIRESLAQARDDVPKRGIGSKIFILIIAVLIVLAIVRIVQIQSQPDEVEEEAKLTNVQVMTVEQGSVEVTAPLSGRVQAKDTVDVVPMASGEVTALNVKEGDHVSAGQVLFTIDNTQSKLQYDQAVLNVQNLENSLVTLNTNLNRMQQLYDAGAIAKSDLEGVEDQIKSTNISLEQARLSAQSASASLGYYTVTAPSSGYVTAVNVTVGGPASSAGAAVSISDTSVLELSTSVSEYLISSISVGQVVDVYVESASKEAFKGTITTISEAPRTGTYTYPVTLRIADPNGVIKAGMFAEVRLVSARKDNVITVPSDSVITSNNEKCVVILNDDDTVSLRTVTVGVDNGTMAEITSGLKRGETVVTKGQTYVDEGEHVNVVS